MKYFGIVLNSGFLRMTLEYTDVDRVDLQGLIVEQSDEIKVSINNRLIPCYGFDKLAEIVKENMMSSGGGVKYLLIGYRNQLRELRCIAEILTSYGVQKEDIINHTVWVHFPHLKRMKYAMEAPADKLDFIATGISYMEAGLDVRQLGELRGANLALSGQDLCHGYRIAEQILLRHKLRFCLIGLSPYSFRYDISKSFSSNFYAYHYQTFLSGFDDDFPDKDTIKMMLNTKFNSLWEAVEKSTDEEILDICHPRTNRIMGLYDLCNWADLLKDMTKKYYPDTVKKNVNILHRYMELCRKYDVCPVLVVFPFSRLVREHFDKAELENFRLVVAQICKIYQAKLIDLFDFELPDNCFFDLDHLNANGAAIVSKEIYRMLEKS